MGARIYVRSVLALAEGMKAGGAGPPIRSDHLGEFYEWLHVASCLDLSASSILWYLAEDRDPARAPIGEELCFLLKEYSVAYGSLIRVLLGRERPHDPREAGLSERHLRWDSDFCRLTLPDFSKHLAAS